MSSNHAFTKKLRGAIKTKIQEYGIDADDELPDYVMVLAANRKEKHQMKSDLQLFLGKHTTSFVDWLFEAFDRIQGSESTSNDKATKPISSSDRTAKEKTDVEQKSTKQSEESPKRRSRSIQSISPPPRLSSVVVVPEKSKRDLSRERRDSKYRGREMNQRFYSQRHEYSRYRSSRNEDSYDDRSRRRDEDSRYRSNSRRNDRDLKEKPTVFSDSDEDKKNPHQTHSKSRSSGSNAPKIHYDNSHKTGASNTSPKRDAVSSDDQKEDEILMVGSDSNNEKQNEAPTRYIIRVGDKKFVRTVPMDDLPDLGSSKQMEEDNLTKESAQRRKRLADDPDRVVRKLMNAHDLKISPTLNARMERFGKENVKKAKLDYSKTSDDNEGVEPYSPTPIYTKEYDSDEEARIDALLKSTAVPQTVTYQPSVAGVQYPQVFNQPQTVGMSRIPERCKFWPDCAKPQECQYVHPSQLCVKFPNCIYGAECLNVHPICKFDGHCTKPHCPYTHHVKTKSSFSYAQPSYSKPSYLKFMPSYNEQNDEQSDSATSTIPCKFGNRCTSSTCVFLHPKTCRFGMTCRNRSTGCPFLHKKPDLSQFQWTASL